MEMKMLMRPNLMVLDVKATTKEAVIDEMIAVLLKDSAIADAAVFRSAIFAREEIGTTGIGDGIAIPHGKSDAVLKSSIVFARSKNGIPFASLDNQDVHLLFMIAVPEDATDEHLKLLASLSKTLMRQGVYDILMLSLIHI